MGETPLFLETPKWPPKSQTAPTCMKNHPLLHLPGLVWLRSPRELRHRRCSPGETWPNSHRIHVWCTYIWLILMVNIGCTHIYIYKCTSPMDPMGLSKKRSFPFNQLLLCSHVTGCKLDFQFNSVSVIVIQNVGGEKISLDPYSATVGETKWDVWQLLGIKKTRRLKETVNNCWCCLIKN